MYDVMLFQAVEKLLATLSDISIDSNLLETPQDRLMGDVALPCFTLAKTLRKSPQQIATDITEQLSPNDEIAKIVATGPYINFFVNPSWIAANILTSISEKTTTYGHAPSN